MAKPEQVIGGPAARAARATAVQRVLPALHARFGDQVSVSRAVRDAHGKGEGLAVTLAPDAVVFARDERDVVDTVRLCAAERVPIIPFGVGTSLEGHVQAPAGGVSLDLSAMDRILSVNPDDLDCRVQAGVTREMLNAHLRDQGLFFPLDPGANATLGGMAATRASGTNAVRYGTMRDVTMGLSVVTPDGRVIRTGGRARKSSAGYDLTRLYVGSEGTLGVITEVQLRLFGVPEAIAAATCQFAGLGDAIAVVTTVLQMGIAVARIEVMDADQMAASIAYSKIVGMAATPSLFLEFHGSPAAVAEQIELVTMICAGSGGGPLIHATLPEQRSALWKARHDAYWAGRSLAPGKDAVTTDSCVPISHLLDAILAAKAEAAASGLICPIVGHVGDGNFHMTILFDPADAGERARAEALATGIAHRAIAVGGTSTGEHGIGSHKIGLMTAEHGDAIAIMRSLKQALDPDNIMNPGKMLPAT